MYPTPRARPTPPNDSEDFLVNRLSTVPLLHLLPHDPDSAAPAPNVPFYNATVTAQEVAKDRYAFYGRGGAGNWRRPSDWNFTSVLSPSPPPQSRSRSPSPLPFAHPLISTRSQTSINTLGSARSGASLRSRFSLRSRRSQTSMNEDGEVNDDTEGENGERRRHRLRRRVSWLVEMVRPLVSRTKSGSGNRRRTVDLDA